MFVQEYDRPNSAYMLFYERADAPEPMQHATGGAARDEADPGVVPMLAEPSYPVAAADTKVEEVMYVRGQELSPITQGLQDLLTCSGLCDSTA